MRSGRRVPFRPRSPRGRVPGRAARRCHGRPRRAARGSPARSYACFSGLDQGFAVPAPIRCRRRPTLLDMTTSPDPTFGRELIARGVAVVGLAGVALIHLLDSLGKFQETPYMGWMSIALMLSCLAAAAALIHTNSRGAWLATLALPASAIIG